MYIFYIDKSKSISVKTKRKKKSFLHPITCDEGTHGYTWSFPVGWAQELTHTLAHELLVSAKCVSWDGVANLFMGTYVNVTLRKWFQDTQKNWLLSGLTLCVGGTATCSLTSRKIRASRKPCLFSVLAQRVFLAGLLMASFWVKSVPLRKKCALLCSHSHATVSVIRESRFCQGLEANMKVEIILNTRS